MKEPRILDPNRTENYCVHKVREWQFCLYCHDIALRAEIRAGVEGLAGADGQWDWYGDDAPPDMVDRAAVLRVIDVGDAPEDFGVDYAPRGFGRKP